VTAERLASFQFEAGREYYATVQAQLEALSKEVLQLKAEEALKKIASSLQEAILGYDNELAAQNAQGIERAVEDLKNQKEYVDGAIDALEFADVVKAIHAYGELVAAYTLRVSNIADTVQKVLTTNADKVVLPNLKKATGVLETQLKTKLAENETYSGLIQNITRNVKTINNLLAQLNDFNASANIKTEAANADALLAQVGNVVEALRSRQVIAEYYPAGTELQNVLTVEAWKVGKDQSQALLKRLQGTSLAINQANVALAANPSVEAQTKSTELKTKLDATMAEASMKITALDLEIAEKAVAKLKAWIEGKAQVEVERKIGAALGDIWPIVLIYGLAFAPFTEVLAIAAAKLPAEVLTTVPPAAAKKFVELEQKKTPAIARPLRDRFLSVEPVRALVYAIDKDEYTTKGVLPPTPLIVEVNILTGGSTLLLPLTAFEVSRGNLSKLSSDVQWALPRYQTIVEEINELAVTVSKFVDGVISGKINPANISVGVPYNFEDMIDSHVRTIDTESKKRLLSPKGAAQLEAIGLLDVIQNNFKLLWISPLKKLINDVCKFRDSRQFVCPSMENSHGFFEVTAQIPAALAKYQDILDDFGKTILRCKATDPREDQLLRTLDGVAVHGSKQLELLWNPQLVG
jgi:hypothetical protein